jgi:hypothetical protein
MPIFEASGAIMNVRLVRLISGSREGLPEGFPDSRDELRFLRERHGEKIAALDAVSGALLGSVSLSLDKDVGGHFFRVAAIDIPHSAAGEGVEAALLSEVKAFIHGRRMARMKLGTSPLLTGSAALYITRFGARYHWREGIGTPAGRPRPSVSCECDFEDPAARPMDLTEEEVAPRSVLSWDGLRPIPRRNVVYAGPLSVLLPELNAETLAGAAAANPEFLPVLWNVFHALFVHGYEFAWFDHRDPAVAAPGEPPCYYVMKSVVSF